MFKMAIFDDFQRLDIRVGKIIGVDDFSGVKIGVKKSCAGLVNTYTKDELKDKLVLGIVNFPPRQISPAVSEVLVLGVSDENNKCILIKPDKKVKLGVKLY